MTLTGVVQNFGGLIACRFLLGAFEAGFFPAAVFIVSHWYLPNETQVRVALFYTSSALAGAFSGLLAFAIAKMDGLAGLAGWRWIFIVEGIATVVAGVATFFILVDSPALSQRWLSQDEIRYLELRHAAVRGSRAESQESISNWRVMKAVLLDWQLYFQALVYWSNTAPNYGLKFTMPQIIKNMGYSSSNAQLLTIPPYVAGAISAYLSALSADRFTWRMPFIVAPQLLVVVSFIILFIKSANISENIGVCYFAIVLACIGFYPINPGGNAWTVENLAGSTKRAAGIAYMLGIGNVGGVIGSYIYIDGQAPRYPTGFGASFGFAALGILSCLVLECGFWAINRQRAKLSEEEVRAAYTDEELAKLGDRSPLFRYTL
ncbi:Major facilitator superfamily domain, general substrate transporter [Akanthomyces lecanii RCEF 1005]|uniref:Major facilitator superfamily domain, general substrate transporter n=1 Tax=Akanthomyces lecanii RCEF 1005 TaxID=1081108 RepID=A0A168H1X1_CORDF|nr:Major facilitator superfamily domain, general substrate transporter [Akanthomyces lecanii RCEF 1005]